MTPEDFLTQYVAALETQNWDVVAPLIHPDCVAVFTEDTFKGKAAVEGAFRKTFALIKDETYSIDNLHWVLQRDDVAVVTYHFHWSGVIHGQSASGGGRGTATLVYADGRWLLLSEHLGPNPR